MTTVTLTEFRNNLDAWHDRVGEGPVEVTSAGETTAVLVSAKMFRDLLSSYRRALPVEELTDAETQSILAAEVETTEPYDLDDIPEIEDDDTPPGSRKSL